MHSQPSTFGALRDPRWLRAFGSHLWRHFREDRCLEAAGALSYTTLLALVPLMAVILGVFSAFPVFDSAVERLQDFIFSNFVPAAGDVVHEYLDQFVERSAQLTGTGTLFLVVAALILMSTIERTLNQIWRVERLRRPSNRLMVYWAVLTLGPLLLGASIGLTSYVEGLQMLTPAFVRGTVEWLVVVTAPFLVALLAFTLIFVVVPNRQVSFRHALTGAAFSALAFELSKFGFVLYVSNFPTYEKIYGALAAVPIFLVWIYVSWVVILLGASLAAALTTFTYHRSHWRWDPRHYLLLAMRMVTHLWRAQVEGRAMTSEELLGKEAAATNDDLQLLLDRLHAANMVRQDEKGAWHLSTDLDEVSLADLYRSMPLVMPIGELDDFPEDRDIDDGIKRALHEIEERAGPLMDRPLKSFVKPKSGATRKTAA